MTADSNGQSMRLAGIGVLLWLGLIVAGALYARGDAFAIWVDGLISRVG